MALFFLDKSEDSGARYICCNKFSSSQVLRIYRCRELYVPTLAPSLPNTHARKLSRSPFVDRIVGSLIDLGKKIWAVLI
jgi:hypothetical protein